jgi:hypothetical protein
VSFCYYFLHLLYKMWFNLFIAPSSIVDKKRPFLCLLIFYLFG